MSIRRPAMPRFPADFYAYLRTHTLLGIKGGRMRPTFLDIWMVEVDGRVFARSWGRSERSWFGAMRAEGVGQVRYGERVIDVRGEPLVGDVEMTRRIDEAYRAKYTQPANRPYAEGITRPEYADWTMELLPLKKT
ncbi:MAG: DUF2255 family protein [Catalinimonas sp.]